MQQLVNVEHVDKVTQNRYEAVIVAAQHARHLNALRLAKLKRLNEEDTGSDIESRKMTMVALRNLIEGRVKFERKDSK
ncbi:MAG: DNA-directed RNA polymerase subunit omega [candidate division Zixibacteria bacterium]|nr:DNA-directed RNA polymerase subunit omega [candidate division Zixibacteria bacterium]